MTALSRLAIAFAASAGILVGQNVAAGTKDEATALGQHVIGLMERALAIQLPEKPPEYLQRKLSDDEFGEYVELYEDRRLSPGAGFFMPEALRDTDRKFYKDVRGFWKLKPAKKMTIVPFLGEQYFAANRGRDLQKIILETLREIESDAFDVQGSDKVFEGIYLEIVERSNHREDRLTVLEFGLNEPILSEAGYLRVLRVADSGEIGDEDLRAQLIRVLAVGWRNHPRPAEVGEYLLRVAGGDECRKCRVMAIESSQIEDFGKEKVLPVYLGVLQKALEASDSELQLRVLWAVGIKAKCIEAVDVIMKTLGSKEPRVRAHAIRSLEQIGGLRSDSIPANFQVIPTDYREERIETEPLNRLERATTRWKNWWRVIGEQVWKSEGEEGFKREAASIYSPK